MSLPLLEKKLIEQANTENAPGMEKYMKNHFPFLGIKTPERKQILKDFWKETEIHKAPFDRDFLIAMWEKDEREYQYIALDYYGKYIKKRPKTDIDLIKYLLTHKSWWDTVDPLASNFAGPLAKNHPDLKETLKEWAKDDNMWLRRTAILFQLRYKSETDEKFLYETILKNNQSKEFFIQKAIGWALREYSKTNPDSVRSFIEGHPLANLSVREGSKYI
ncbi:DNA alkylation repair protein [Falsibacillus albus]|uniref:DNA alkylation repair protein n=1 Tax=Falsibacillus albus TaxID=2478915 RepID=A0A3L7JRY0_9BACI|nr:DNA alkylation repair protein [Falsibacillus albus]RLQ93436.1 DNA alkylation repair protein [Falsibacillus albus]